MPRAQGVVWEVVLLGILLMSGPIISHLIVGPTISGTWFMIIFPPILMGMAAFSFVQNRQTWRYTKKILRSSPDKAVNAIERALRRSDIPFERAKKLEISDHPSPEFSQLIKVDHLGATILLKDLNPGSWVFVGPVTRDTWDGIERIKGIIDGTLAPPHHHEGDE